MEITLKITLVDTGDDEEAVYQTLCAALWRVDEVTEIEAVE